MDSEGLVCSSERSKAQLVLDMSYAKGCDYSLHLHIKAACFHCTLPVRLRTNQLIKQLLKQVKPTLTWAHMTPYFSGGRRKGPLMNRHRQPPQTSRYSRLQESGPVVTSTQLHLYDSTVTPSDSLCQSLMAVPRGSSGECYSASIT